MAPLFNPELDGLFGQANLSINWRGIVATGCYVSRAYLSRNGAFRLEDVFLTWFMRNGHPVCHIADRQYPGLPVTWPQQGDTTVTVGQAAADGFHHPWMSEERIRNYRPNGPLRLKLPAYNVERGYLLLDGAHRSIAAVRAGVEYNVELAVIHGPVSHVFADLVVFERPP